jgi:hypothetical protein
MCNNQFVKKILITFFSFLIAFSVFVANSTTANAKSSPAKRPGLTASVAKNRLSVATTFTNLSNVKSISYELTYSSAKGPQGAGGTIKVGTNSKNLSRKLLLGTCSGKVCTYHKNVKNIKLSVDFKLNSGGVISYEKNLK